MVELREKCSCGAELLWKGFSYEALSNGNVFLSKWRVRHSKVCSLIGLSLDDVFS